jgi:uncharacterized protein YjiS (DUF1127 family)
MTQATQYRVQFMENKPMRQECIDTIETSTAPLPSWGQWLQAGATLVKKDTLQIVRLLWTWSERSRQRFQLQQLSDDMLKDVGLNRVDVDGESSKHFWQE